MSGLLPDLKSAARTLRRARAHAIWIVVTIGAGVGANAAVYALLGRTLLHPLPYSAPERLVQVWEDFSAFGTPHARVSPGTYLDWRRRATGFADLAAYRLAALNVTGDTEPEEVLAIAATSNLLPMLGVSPRAGRFFTDDEDRGAARVVILSDRIRVRRFGGDSSVIGRTLRVDGEPYTVVGVMPAGFNFPDGETDCWIPLGMTPQQSVRRNSHYLKVVGRIAEGPSLAQARAEMDAIARRLAAEFPSTNANVGITVVPLKEEWLAGTTRPLLVLSATAACVLLIACVNVGNLVLVRWTSRRDEMRTRLALGASRVRLLQASVAEALLAGTGAAALAVVVARTGAAGLSWLVPAAIGDAAASSFTTIGLLGVAMLAIAVTIVATVLPVLGSILVGRGDSIPLADARIVSGGRSRGRQALLVAQIALALLLVSSAGLMIRTLLKLSRIDAGFHAAGVLTARIAVSPSRYADPSARTDFFTRVLSEIRRIPGVETASLTSDLPYTNRGNSMSVAVERREAAGGPGEDALFRLVSAGYLQTIGARAVAGRLLDDRDTTRALPVVVVNESFVRRYLADGAALGRRINVGTGGDQTLWLTVVGIVHDVLEAGADFEPRPAVYVPFPQARITFFQPSQLAIRTSLEPLSLASAVTRAVWTLDPDAPVVDVRTLADIVRGDQAMRRRVLELLTAAAALALGLAAFGIYGVLSYAITQRRTEIAVRLACGATPSTILASVISEAARVAGVGTAFGLLGCAAATRLLGALLFEVSPLDWRTLSAAALLLGAAALCAAWVPARRAAGLDPVEVFRSAVGR